MAIHACKPLPQLGKRSYSDMVLTCQAWELFFLVASTMPPSKEFVGLVSEYVHTVAHGETEGDEEVQKLARRTWGGLKRSAKAGPRRTVSAPSFRRFQV